MSVVLATSLVQTDMSMNVTQTGNTLDVTAITAGTGENAIIRLGTLIGTSTQVMVVSQISGTIGGVGLYKVDLSGNLAGSQAVIGYTTTVQDALNTFLANPGFSKANYCKLIASSTAAVNAINAANPTTSATGKNGLRLFLASDDGTPIMDTGKCTFASSTTNQIISLVTTSPSSTTGVLGNTYVNQKNKIQISSGEYSTNNLDAFTDVSGNTVFTVLGTAGGNGINENHHSRPEFLAALLKDSGIGFSNRYSSSTSTTNYYMAQRFGISLEANAGTIRINVPVVEASS
jgi:hypothetical protein